MLHNINSLYLHCVFHGIRFKVNNEDWLSVKIAFFCFTRLMLFPPRSDHFIRIARSFGILDYICISEKIHCNKNIFIWKCTKQMITGMPIWLIGVVGGADCYCRSSLWDCGIISVV